MQCSWRLHYRCISRDPVEMRHIRLLEKKRLDRPPPLSRPQTRLIEFPFEGDEEKDDTRRFLSRFVIRKTFLSRLTKERKDTKRFFFLFIVIVHYERIRINCQTYISIKSTFPNTQSRRRLLNSSFCAFCDEWKTCQWLAHDPFLAWLIKAVVSAAFEKAIALAFISSFLTISETCFFLCNYASH